MHRFRRRGRHATIGVSCCLALAVAGAGAAADAVPRPPGAIDGRGWELVSPPDKNRNAVLEGAAVASEDGQRVLFGTFGGVPIAPAGGRPKLLATRGADGWSVTSPLPARVQMLADTYAVAAYAPDLGGWIASAQDSLGATDFSPDVSLVRLDDEGHQTLLHTFPVYFGASGVETVASDDLAHVYAVVPEPIDPSQLPGTDDVYDFGSGAPRLVSRMPASGLAPTCGVQEGVEFANALPGATSQNWSSRDGARVFFRSRGDDAPACDDPPQLYVHDSQGTDDPADDATTLISGPPLPGDSDAGAEQFLQATPDGSQAFFRTATSLDPRDDADGSATDLDIYRWSSAEGDVCVTCVVGGANVLSGDRMAAIAQDGGRVYFASAAALTPDAPPASDAQPDVYVVAGASIRWVATTDAMDGVTDQPRWGGALTPDGAVLILRTAGPGSGGKAQFYRYDDRDGGIVCISCPPTGATLDVPSALAASNQAVPARLRVLSDDGRIVFFPSDEALVAADLNQDRDLYEWHDGVLGLITSGVKHYTKISRPSLYTTTASGRDVFFRDNAALTPAVQDATFQLYDARVGGGFAPTAAPPAPCEGEACRGPLPAAPQLARPASALLHGREERATPAPWMTVRGRASGAALVLHVRASVAGRVSAVAQARLGGAVELVDRAVARARGPATLTLRLTLSRPARAWLARTGRLRLVVTVRHARVPRARRLVLELKAARRAR